MAALITWTGHNFVDIATLTLESGISQSEFPLSRMQDRGLAGYFMAQRGVPPTITIRVDNLAMDYERLDQGFGADVGGVVNAIAVQPDGKILIVGNFTSVAGVARNRIARLHADGALDTGFDPNCNGELYAIALQPDGKIIVGGSFTSIAGAARNRIARLHADGTLDAAFGSGTYGAGANGPVNAIAIQSDGKIIFAGSFTFANSLTTRNRIARLHVDGTLDNGYNPDASSVVNAVVIQSDGKAVVAGSFTSVSATARNRIARINTDGSLDTGYNPNANNTINSIARQNDGKMIVGGGFTTVSITARNRIARINTDGTLDTGFNPNSNGTVSSVSVDIFGVVCACGAFTTMGGVAASYVAKIRSDGSVDGDFIHGVAYTSAKTVLSQPDAVLVGGNLPAAGRLIRLHTSSPQRARIIALLGMQMPGGFAGEVVVAYRRSATDLWSEFDADKIDLSAQRLLVAGLPACAVIRVPQDVPASCQFEIRVTVPVDAYFGIGRLWIGDALVLPDGIDAGWSMGFRDSGSLDPTDGQQWIESPGVRTRVLNIPLDGARETETAWGFADDATAITNSMSLHALQMQAGTTGEVIAVARTMTPLWTRHSAVYGHIEQPWAIGHKAGPYWGAGLQVVEER